MHNKKGLWLFILGLSLIGICVLAIIGAIVFEFLYYDDLFNVMAIVIMITGPLSVLCLIFKLIFYGGAKQEVKTPTVKTYKYNEKSIPIVDVKEFKKSQDEIMYEKYVDLYNKKIITKEDLDKKRKELLGK